MTAPEIQVPERDEDARFAPPPDPGASGGSGSFEVGPGRTTMILRFMHVMSVGALVMCSIAVASRLGGSEHLVAVASGLALALVWVLAARARTPRRRIEWDAWGITEETRGDRVAIPWSGARARVSRAGERVIVQIVDDDERSIVCACGVDLPVWAEGSVARREDVERLIVAAGRLPWADPRPIEPNRDIYVASAAFVLATVVGGIALALSQPLLASAATSLLLAYAISPDLVRGRALVRRGWAMRGARRVDLARDRLAIARPGSAPIPLVLDEPPRDARLAERGEPVRVLLADASDGDPYRARVSAHAKRIEPLRERGARRREGAWIALRTLVAGGAAAALAVAPLAAPPIPREVRDTGPTMPSLAAPRPPQPTAWRAPPRAPIVHRATRPTCEPDGTSCYPAITYLDEVGREVFRCDGWQRERCDRELREAIPDAELSD